MPKYIRYSNLASHDSKFGKCEPVTVDHQFYAVTRLIPLFWVAYLQV